MAKSATRFCIFEVGSNNDMKIVEDYPDAINASKRAGEAADETGKTHLVIACIVFHPKSDAAKPAKTASR
jgi:hypothetical protein